ncbi:DUF2505 domain-containing protein [Mycobacterium sp.]|uniref:DUF2505 domain-containing protein n=1 Tax=Mycobacterium sp. TaxID=1785 RepID=UPI003C7941EF
MPRSFDVSVDFENNIDEVFRAFSTEDYWLARLAESGADDTKLESLRVGGRSGTERTIEVVTLQVAHRHNLSAMIAPLLRGDLCLRRAETWGPVSDGVATASVEASVEGAPAAVSGTALLSPLAKSGGSLLDGTFTVQVRVPLIGGKLEKIIGAELGGLLVAEQRFTKEWLTNNF